MEKIEYSTIDERDRIIKSKILEGFKLVEDYTFKYLIFGTIDEITKFPEQVPSEMELFQQKVTEQESIIQELVFEIIPSLGGM